MNVILPLPPSANRLWRYANGRAYVTREARAYKELCYWTAKKQGANPLDGPVILRGTVYFGRKNGDLTNRIKILEDALEGACYHNDSQVVRIDLAKGYDKEQPRVELDVLEAI